MIATILQLAQVGTFLFQGYTQAMSLHFYISLLPHILFVLTNLALVRIFLELALQFIEKRTVTV